MLRKFNIMLMLAGMIFSSYIRGKKTVFFGCSMRGGQEIVSEDDLRELQNSVETNLGFDLASKHQTQPGTIAWEDRKEPWQIFERDCKYVLSSRVAVFEISNPSLGVGAEMMLALLAGIPILCLYYPEPNEVSAFIRGMENSWLRRAPFRCCRYRDLDHAKDIMGEFLRRWV